MQPSSCGILQVLRLLGKVGYLGTVGWFGMVGWLGILIEGSCMTESRGGLIGGNETCGRNDTESLVKEGKFGVEGGISMSGKCWIERR